MIDDQVQIYFAQYDRTLNKLSMLDEWNKEPKYLIDNGVYAIISVKDYALLISEGKLEKKIIQEEKE